MKTLLAECLPDTHCPSYSCRRLSETGWSPLTASQKCLHPQQRKGCLLSQSLPIWKRTHDKENTIPVDTMQTSETGSNLSQHSLPACLPSCLSSLLFIFLLPFNPGMLCVCHLGCHAWALLNIFFLNKADYHHMKHLSWMGIVVEAQVLYTLLQWKSVWRFEHENAAMHISLAKKGHSLPLLESCKRSNEEEASPYPDR